MKKRTTNKPTALDYFTGKYNLDISQSSPIFVPQLDRIDLATLYKELKFNIGAEIGVLAGIYSEELCKANPSLNLFAIDAWKKYPGYVDIKGKQERYNRIYNQAVERLAPYNCHLVKKWSEDAVNDFEDESLDFIFIDGNHDFEHCTKDIENWSKKVRKGGIISGHDFFSCRENNLIIQVEEAVTGWTKEHAINPWFVLTKDTKSPTWMWVKT
ncbi:MAG: hypothetical protein UW68_C0027G0015 [Candidatus Collierbacteria bacterium GW2011_GWB1_44_6]|uniref:Class I SAM-dependent methyltransferase n=1 Tax=Candidatus Collierbacteria bacterium GW2011_GWB1_44_6 TaxID=1618384 RepID=A0A0G1ML54_9BACT|nr:MAG: hypothetical protein UW68_C0027G0015 [Candidatus Collierbacteria bacterium GW2011_GWB1_44_6]KKT81557.1 MAG: hypothetical protein UW80_C0049G0005 [Microgenomates group bacterium GW2011_GWC1_44_9]